MRAHTHTHSKRGSEKARRYKRERKVRRQDRIDRHRESETGRQQASPQQASPSLVCVASYGSPKKEPAGKAKEGP